MIRYFVFVLVMIVSVAMILITNLQDDGEFTILVFTFLGAFVISYHMIVFLKLDG